MGKNKPPELVIYILPLLPFGHEKAAVTILVTAVASAFVYLSKYF